MRGGSRGAGAAQSCAIIPPSRRLFEFKADRPCHRPALGDHGCLLPLCWAAISPLWSQIVNYHLSVIIKRGKSAF